MKAVPLDAPEGIREFYKKMEDGSFVLGVDVVDGFGLGPIGASYVSPARTMRSAGYTLLNLHVSLHH